MHTLVKILIFYVVLPTGAIGKTRRKDLFHHSNDISYNSTLNLTCQNKSSQTFLIVSNTSEPNRRRVMKLASNISASEDVAALLDLVSWNMFKYFCQQTCDDNGFKIKSFCPNAAMCCLNNSMGEFLFFNPKCGPSGCIGLVDLYVISKWFIFLFCGLLCMFGNFVVIYYKLKCLRKQKNRGKEVQIYNMLVLNLAFADFLMGFYLTAVSIVIKHKVDKRLFFSGPGFCNVLGVINAVSIQVSITVLLIISIYRLIGVVFPYKNLHITVVSWLVLMTWLVWFTVAILPLLPIEPLTTTFRFGLAKEQQLEKGSLFDFSKFTSFLKSNITTDALSNDSELKTVLQAIVQHPSALVLAKTADALGLINIETENWSVLGYYNVQYACAINFFVVNETNKLFNHFTLSFLYYNLIGSFTILIAYVLVTWKVSGNDVVSSICNHCASGQKILRKNSFANGPNQTKRSSENKKLFRRISIIVSTNLFCWLPLCVTSLVISTLPFDSVETIHQPLSIQTVMLLVVPLNSISNPYIYSYDLWKRLLAKLKK